MTEERLAELERVAAVHIDGGHSEWVLDVVRAGELAELCRCMRYGHESGLWNGIRESGESTAAPEGGGVVSAGIEMPSVTDYIAATEMLEGALHYLDDMACQLSVGTWQWAHTNVSRSLLRSALEMLRHKPTKENGDE